MKDNGYVLDAKEPHFSLTGTSRKKDYIKSGLQKLIKEMSSKN
jgi:hypothetical protein